MKPLREQLADVETIIANMNTQVKECHLLLKTCENQGANMAMAKLYDAGLYKERRSLIAKIIELETRRSPFLALRKKLTNAIREEEAAQNPPPKD